MRCKAGYTPARRGHNRLAAAGVKQERKRFFFEKKNQKTFVYGARAVAGVSDSGPGRQGKSFLVLFFKKELLAYLLCEACEMSTARVAAETGEIAGSDMQRFGIEDENWFEAARTGLERRGFRLRIQQRSIVIDKDGRLPRIVGSAREFLELAERQGLQVSAADYEAADRYGDGRSDLSGRFTPSPFETPPAVEGVPRPIVMPDRRPDVSAVEQRIAELRLEQDRVAEERRSTHTLLHDKKRLEERCAELEAEVSRLSDLSAEAVKQRDIWQLAAAAAEERLKVLQAELDLPSVVKGGDKRFDQLRRFLARELHPDLAGENEAERVLREALFKRVWSKVLELN